MGRAMNPGSGVLQIDGKPVATHAFSRASDEWREFRRTLQTALELPRLSNLMRPKRPHCVV